MAVITPDTDLYLLKVPLEINDMNQLTFANKEAQFNYFNSLPKLEAENFTYQRQDGTIRFSGNYDELISYNYCMYRNTAFSDKWFYAFITAMEWKSPNSTDIAIKTDCWQTYQFDLTFKPVLIDREHTNDDTIGANTIPENLELGEIITNGGIENFGWASDNYVVIADVTMLSNYGQDQTLTHSWSGTSQTDPDNIINGIPSGVWHIILGWDSNNLTDFNKLVEVYTKAGLADAIESIYVVPKNIIDSTYVKTGLTISTTGSAPQGTISDLAIAGGSAGSSYLYDRTTLMTTKVFNKPSSLNNYQPKNAKLLTFPYCYFNVSNNAGITVTYHYEDFKNYYPQASYGTLGFRVEGVLTPSGSFKAIPLYYKGIEDENELNQNAYEYSINGAKFPICNWVTDSYTNWLTQNAVNMNMQWRSELIRTGTGLGLGLVQGITSGGALGGAIGAGSSLIESGSKLIGIAKEQHLAKTDANLVPDQAHGNQNCGDIIWSKFRSKFSFIPMCIKSEYARCIDDYFSQFGYQTNRIKLPNITGRRNWNYVKTTGCYIEADIPQSDLAEIKNMFDNGVTFWHNPATFADYSQNNDII